jgi:hypothetical protein
MGVPYAYNRDMAHEQAHGTAACTCRPITGGEFDEQLVEVCDYCTDLESQEATHDEDDDCGCDVYDFGPERGGVRFVFCDRHKAEYEMGAFD